MVSGAEDCFPLIAGRWEGTSRIESAAGAGPQADLAFTVAPRDGDSGVPGLRGDYAIIDQVPPPPDGDYGYTMLCDRRGNDLLCEALFFSEGCGSAPYARLPADWTIAPDGSTLSRQQIVDTIVDPSRCTVRPMAETVRGANMPDHVVVTTIMHRTEQ
jgi:hypothetical protein